MPVRSESTLVIAGAGLAGACSALALANTHRVIVLDADKAGKGASGAAAGLVNPFMGRKAKPAWRHREALDALHTTLDSADATHLFLPTGVLRPTADARQLEAFQVSAQDNGLEWMESEAVAERWPEVQAPHGALWIPEGGSVDLTKMVHACLRAAEARGAEVYEHRRLTGWEFRDRQLYALTDRGDLETDRLLLAVGDGTRHLSALADLPLHRVKGQTVELAPCPVDLPAVSGGVYIVPRPDRVLVGATFEHHFADLRPDPAASSRLVGRARHLVPSLEGTVRTTRVGVRLTVPTHASQRRLPLLGPMPGHPGVWVFAGLGAKGLLTAPLLARYLPDALANPGTLPVEIRGPLMG